jgi:uncharacterized membrane protein SpoIIM required for sporulation/uncharacterized RDD family membrane protein YckC
MDLNDPESHIGRGPHRSTRSIRDRMTTPTTLAPISGRQVEVETPEHVAVGYELADLGSRFTALVIDGAILVSVLLVMWIVLPLTVALVGGLPELVKSAGLAMLTVASVAVLWGYFAYFESARDGQTPGKRRLGLRVVLDGGYPVTARAALVRNLLRAVDILPPPTWLVGGAVMMLHPQTKRIGDIVAGTMVVREPRELSLPEEQAEGGAAGPPRLTEEEFATLARYVDRRAALPDEARGRIATRLVQQLAARLPEDEPGRRVMSPDRFLAKLHEDELQRRAAGGHSAGNPQAAVLVRAQRGKWNAYRGLVEEATKRGLRALPEEDVSRFASLYRETAADLARARTYRASPELVYALERWVGAGHNLLYRPGARTGRELVAWLARGFPALVRRRWRPIALAALLLYGPMAVVAASVYVEPSRARSILPAQMLARAEEGAERRGAGLGYVDVPEIGMPLMAGQIIANNVQVTLLAFAGGVTGGLATTATLVFNGVFIGAMFGLFAAYALSGHLFAFVLPHGVVELTAICIAGGAGLHLGSALLMPGRATRGAALVSRGREAVALLGGTVVLLVVAGLIEGFISPARLPFAVKGAVSALSFVLLFLYLLTPSVRRTVRAGDAP